MSTDDTPASLLRSAAEAELARSSASASGGRSAEALLHELQVHQIELEMQNEALRQSQEALEASRDRYVDLYEFAPLGYLTLSTAGQILRINLTGAAFLGEERGKLAGRWLSRYVVTEDRDAWARCLQSMVHQGGKQSCELGLARGDGSVSAVFLEGGISGSGPDGPELRVALSEISALRRTMAELRQSEARLQLAKESAGLGVHDRDILSGKMEWDERMRSFWGFSPDEPVSYAMFLDGVHPDDRQAVERAAAQALNPAGSGEYGIEYRVVNQADRCVRHLVSKGKAFFAEGRAVRLIGMARDISLQKHLERELQEQKNEMDALASQQVAVHTAMEIAHELNQPLASCCAYSEAALGMLRAGLKHPDKLVRALEGAAAQGHRAGQTLHELIAFLHGGQAVLEAVDLNSLVGEALAIAMANTAGVFSSRVELDAGLGPVCSNNLQLLRVVVNLLHNGMEAMVAAGLQGGCINVKSFAEGPLAQLTVQDSGPGINAETARRMFEPFFSTKPGGLGLGLSISRALIESQGGQLWVDPGCDAGATLHLSLPFYA